MKLSGVKKVNEFVWEIPAGAKHGMKVPARIYADEKLLQGMDDAVFDQITNVAFLPGILDYALCMPDGHSGYGFPIGGVAAIDPADGVISPGGIGFDINCGIRLDHHLALAGGGGAAYQATGGPTLPKAFPRAWVRTG